jgi:transcriptional regulator with XRE-family HTH domain
MFGERLQRLRERAGLSQYALARLAGLSKQAVSHLELGIREPGWETVQRLALALGASCEDFRDPGLSLPADGGEPRPRGRPPKAAAPAGPKKAPRRRKGDAER